jgi:hypothetical protein
MPETFPTPQGPMTADEIRRAFGWAELQPTEPVVAGSWGTWRLVYHVGEYGLDDGGTLMVSWRFATDWGRPQFGDPAASNYCSLETDGPALLKGRFDTKAGVRPWRKSIVVDVFDDGLREGDTITLIFGDTSGGSRGSRAQTFCEYTFEWRVLVNPFATGLFIQLPDPPEIEIVSGPAERLICILPSRADAGEQIEAIVKAEDAWGNPARGYEGTVRFAGDGFEGLPESYTFTAADAGIHRFPCTVPEQGEHRLVVRDEALGVCATSNPLVAPEEMLVTRVYWAELHGQSEETVGTNTAEDYHRFARDYGCVDVVGHQGNDFQVTEENWAEFTRLAREFTDPGRFVVLLGYEWSGNTGGGGDHNVYYRTPGQPIFRSCHALIPDTSTVASDRYPVAALYEELRRRDGIAIPHVGGRRADLAQHDPEVVPAVEIYSAWGQFEWQLTGSLALGHRVGVVAGSDGHKGRPGASYPGASQFGAYGGLTGIIADELTPDAIFDAIRARRCYATTGQRIVLRVQANSAPMGSEITADGPVTFGVFCAGTAGIRSIEVLRQALGAAEPEVAYVHDPLGDAPLSDDRLRIIWSGARILGRDRATCWDGRLDVTGAMIVSAEPYAFDGPQEGLTEVAPEFVEWQSITTGDEDGLDLCLNRLGGAHLSFRSGPACFALEPATLGREPIIIEAGGVDQRVVVRRLPEGEPPLSVTFTYADDPPAGATAYWVRVTQDDGAHAWSSPVFVERA